MKNKNKKRASTSKLVVIGVLVLGTVTYAPPTMADVDTREGSFTNQWLNQVGPADDSPLTIDRQYRSRSHYRGIFGFRWCSSFDKYFSYSEPLNFSASPRFCETTPPPTYSYANRLHKISSQTWLLTDEQGRRVIFTFDTAQTLLVGINRDDGYGLRFTYKNNILSHVESVVPRGFGSGAAPASESYRYDLSRNLVEVKAHDRIQFRIEYDLAYDRVTAIADDKRCTDWFDYATKDLVNHEQIQTTKHRRLCWGQALQTNQYEFVHSPVPGTGQMRLRRLRVVDLDGHQQEVKYD